MKSSRHVTSYRNEMRKPKDQSYETRHVGRRQQKERLLIVCEGEKTEPNYFDSFPVHRKEVYLQIEGVGYNTLSLVNKAIVLRNAAKANGDAFHQVWCVFDRDSFSLLQFNSALKLASDEGIHVAYSNESFEIWYLLHYDYCETKISRETYKKRLSKHLGYQYEKNSKTIYKDILKKQGDAILRATKLHSLNALPSKEQDNSCTTVYKLVIELNKYLIGRYHSTSE